jgi:chemotaxis protein histidine kinase CheA
VTLVELRERFLSGLERRLSDVSGVLMEGTNTDAVMRAFHSVVGIAGTYGFHDITDLSRICEELARTAVEEGRPLAPAENQEIETTIARIRIAARDASQCSAVDLIAAGPASR